MSETVESLIAYCREKERVCPMPQKWNQLWQMLPERRQVGVGWEPALPLILEAWHYAPANSKMLRLAEHIEWAEKHGVLQEIGMFVRGLPEREWYHLGE